jgi:hypothetical protein
MNTKLVAGLSILVLLLSIASVIGGHYAEARSKIDTNGKVVRDSKPLPHSTHSPEKHLTKATTNHHK